MLVELVEHALPERVRRERERRGTIPLGCTVAREEAGLQALEAGADEAMVLSTADPEAIHTLFDRTLLRATLRREGERATASVGHADKLAALGALVAGVAHEINNPLTIVTLSASMLRRVTERVIRARSELDRLAGLGRPVQPSDLQVLMANLPDRSEARELELVLDDVTDGIDAVRDVVRDLRVFARMEDDTASEWLDLRAVVDQVLRIVRREIERSAILERDLPADLPRLYAPRTRIVQVLTNVLINAAHAVREVERPVHRVRISARADDEAIAIVVADTGPGIAPADLDRIFDPFYTTKRQGIGTGLGLSISRSILRGMGGDMMVDSVHGDGASFVLAIPRIDDDAQVPPASSNRSRTVAADDGRRTVLVVGARDAMVRAYGRALADRYDVVIADDAEEAVALLGSGTCPDLVLAEGSPSDFDAHAIHAWLQRERPPLASRTVFVSSEPEELGSKSPRHLRVLHKPVSREQLLRALDLTAAPSDPLVD